MLPCVSIVPVVSQAKTHATARWQHSCRASSQQQASNSPGYPYQGRSPGTSKSVKVAWVCTTTLVSTIASANLTPAPVRVATAVTGLLLRVLLDSCAATLVWNISFVSYLRLWRAILRHKLTCRNQVATQLPSNTISSKPVMAILTSVATLLWHVRCQQAHHLAQTKP